MTKRSAKNRTLAVTKETLRQLDRRSLKTAHGGTEADYCTTGPFKVWRTDANN